MQQSHDAEFVSAAISNNAEAIRSASDRLKNDQKFLLESIEKIQKF